MLEKLLAYLDKHQLLDDVKRLLLAVSGGLDSVVMLDLFCGIQKEKALFLGVVHVNHRLRETAGRDEMFVRNAAEKCGLPYYAEHVNVKAYASENKMSIEEAGRLLRHQAFFKIMRDYNFQCVSLAHHADDQAETVLMNLLRGSGLRGLGGIKPRRDHIIHPLLFAQKSEIMSYASSRDISFVEDETNADTAFQRNKIRHDVIPFLENAVKRPVARILSQTAARLAEVDAWLSQTAEDAEKQSLILEDSFEIALAINPFFSYLKAVQKAVFMRIIERFSASFQPNFYDIEMLADFIEKGRPGDKIVLNNNLRIFRETDRVVFVKPPFVWPARPLPLNGECVIEETGYIVGCKTVSVPDIDIIKKHGQDLEIIDRDCIKNDLIVRPFKHGDRFIPLGMSKYKKVSDFFTDEKIPVYRRGRIPVVASGDDIVWIAGYRLGQAFRITEQTRHCLRLSVELCNSKNQQCSF